MSEEYGEEKHYNEQKIQNRRIPQGSNVLLLLGNLLPPQTEGFNHINLDMAFTNLDQYSIFNVQNSSTIIAFSTLWGFKKVGYMERNKLATDLISRRSLNKASMELFTNVTNINKNEFEDKTPKKTGFMSLFRRKEPPGGVQ